MVAPIAEMTRGEGATGETLRVGPVEVRPEEFGVLVEGKRVHLTVRECQVLEALVARAHAVVPRVLLYEKIWGGQLRHRDRSVDAVVHRIRLKLAEVSPDWVFIHTHFGIGYRFTPEERGDGDA